MNAAQTILNGYRAEANKATAALARSLSGKDVATLTDDELGEINIMAGYATKMNQEYLRAMARHQGERR